MNYRPITRRSQQTRDRIRAAALRRWADPAEREAASLRGRGRKHTDATKELIRSQRTGSKASDETRAKMSAANMGRTVAGKARYGLTNGRWIADRDEARRRRVAALWVRDTLKRATRSARKCSLRSSEVWTVLGYSKAEFIGRIESTFQPGMSWRNWGDWHVDHIRPVARFDTGTPLQVVNSLSNLQALWAIDNRKKAAKVAA